MFIICPTIRNGFDINYVRLKTFLCKFYMLSIKFNYVPPFSLLKLLHSWFHPPVSLFDPFVSFLCLRLFNISSTCPRYVFDPVKCKARFLFCDALHCCLQYFAVFLIVEALTLIIAMTKAIVCIWKFFRLVIFSHLYPSWSIFFSSNAVFYDLLHISLQISSKEATIPPTSSTLCPQV